DRGEHLRRRCRRAVGVEDEHAGVSDDRDGVAVETDVPVRLRDEQIDALRHLDRARRGPLVVGARESQNAENEGAECSHAGSYNSWMALLVTAWLAFVTM